MSKKKDELFEEETKEQETPKEEIVLVDENGKQLTEEEAQAEEERLHSIMNQFFLTNLPNNNTLAADEQEDDEEITVKVDNEGKVLKEETVKKETVEKETFVPTNNEPSIFEETMTEKFIQSYMEKIDLSYNSIMKLQDDFLVLSQGGKLYDDVIDAYRKEKNELRSLLMVKPVSLHNLKNERLKARLEAEFRQFTRSLFDIVSELN